MNPPRSSAHATRPRLANGILALVPLSSVALLGSVATAATLTWDTTPAIGPLITEGSGTWINGSGNWNNGTTAVNWNNATPDAAVFGGGATAEGTAGIVTLGGDITSSSMTFNAPKAGSYTIELDSHTLTNGNITYSAGTAAATIQSTGGGTLALSGNSTFGVTSGVTTGLTVSAKITGAFSLLKAGQGTLTLTNDDNSFSGGLTTQNGGNTVLTSIRNTNVNSAAGSAGSISILANSGIRYIGSGDSTNRILNFTGTSPTNSNLVSDGSGALVFTGTVTNSVIGATTTFLSGTNADLNEIQGNLTLAMGVTKNGSGIWKLSGTNSYTGATSVDVGTLVFGKKASQSATTVVNVNNSGTLGLGVGASSGDYTDADVAALFNSNSLTGVVLAANSGVALDTTAGNFTQTTALTGSRALTKLGANTLTMTVANGYTGVTTIRTGTLQLGNGTTGNDGTLASASIVNNANLTFNRFGSTSSAAVISGTGSVTKIGAGIQILMGTSTYGGGTLVNGGTLRLGATNALAGATGLVNVDGGTLDSSVSAASLGGPLGLTSGMIEINGGSTGTFMLGSGGGFSMLGGTFKLNLGTVFDQLVGNGVAAAFNISGGTFELDVTGTGFNYANSYQVLSNFLGSNTVSGLAITGYDTSNYTAMLSDSGAISFTPTLIPETQSVAALTLGLAGLAFRRRRTPA